MAKETDGEITQFTSTYPVRCLCCDGRKSYVSVDTGTDIFTFTCYKCKMKFAVSWKRLNKLVGKLRYELRKQEMKQAAEGENNGD